MPVDRVTQRLIDCGDSYMDTSWQQYLDRAIDELSGELIEIRRHLHQYPEISGHEYRTTEFLLERLQSRGLCGITPDTKRGVICDDGEATAGKIALRADIDALQIQDTKQVAYRSQHEGVMHACGHDAHSAILYGALCGLRQLRLTDGLPWPVTVRGIFQPAEETAKGAREMVAAGALSGVSAILATHVDPHREAGSIGLRDGVSTANCDEIRVRLQGVGGHAARPHDTRDPIHAAAQLIQNTYSLVSRKIDSQDAVIVTFGHIAGGSNSNVIPDSVEMRGTMRTLCNQVRIRAKEQLQQVCRGVSEATGVEIELEMVNELASVFNDADLNEILMRSGSEVLGAGRVERIPRASMGSEDFAVYLEQVPGAMFRLGIATEELRAPLHSTNFDISEETIMMGAKILARSAILWCDPHRSLDKSATAAEIRS